MYNMSTSTNIQFTEHIACFCSWAIQFYII